MRAFLALPLPDSVREAAASAQQLLAASRADIKWVEPQNLHLTLRFLGELTDVKRQELEASLAPVAVRTRAWRLGLEQIGAFPSVAAPRVVWIGVGEGREAAAQLAEQIEAVCAPLGLQGESRPFSAHVTLGRVRGTRHRHALVAALSTAAWSPPPALDATELRLYESELSLSGPAYRVVTSWAFAGA